MKNIKMKFVQSRYRAHWKGIVLNTYKYDNSYIFLCLIIYDKHNNLITRRITKTLDFHWLVETEPFDISMIPRVWFNTYKSDIEYKIKI